MEDRQPAGRVAAFCIEQNINLRETNITYPHLTFALVIQRRNILLSCSKARLIGE